METLTQLFESRLAGFLERTGLKPSTFGLLATGDPNLIRQLHRGRSPTLALADRILAFMEAFDQAQLEPDSTESDRLRDSSSRERSGRAMTRAAAQQPDASTRIVRMPSVEARTGLSRSTIYVRVAEGSFPAPVQLGARAVGWIEAEVDAWIEQQIAASRGDTE